MGILDRLGISRDALRHTSSVFQLGIKSPWAEGSLHPILWSELFGRDIDEYPLTREEAIAIPSVSKGRNLLVSTIAKFPLVALGNEWREASLDEQLTWGHLCELGPDGKLYTQLLADQPTWLYRTDSSMTPYDRMAWTVDDLIFYGASLWLLDRGAEKDGRRPILNAEWCHPADWTVTDGHILVNEQEVDDDDILLFNPPFQGLLNVGNRTLRGARDTERAWVGRMRNPIPLIELRVTDDSNLTQEEVDDYVKAWALARRQENGAVNFTPPGIELHTHGEVDPGLFTEGRNAIRTDVGSFINVRAAMLDGTVGIDSLTYTTKDGEKNLFYEFDLPFFTDPMEATLSHDKPMPRGQRVRFDKYAASNLPKPTGTPTED